MSACIWVHKYVHLYVCAWVCVRVCMYVCMHGCMVCIQVCARMCMHGCVCAQVHVCAQVCVHGCIVCALARVRACVCTGVCAWVHVCAQVCVHRCGFGMTKALGRRQILPWPWWTTPKADSHSFFIFGLDKFQTVPTVMRQAVQRTISLNSCPMILCTWYMRLLKEQRPVGDLSRAGGPSRWRACAHKGCRSSLCSFVALGSSKNSLSTLLLGYAN